MEHEEMIEEISRRSGISVEDVAEVLDVEEQIYIEEDEKEIEAFIKARKRKKMCILGTVIIFLAGVVFAVIMLDKKEKISIKEIEGLVKENVKKYTDKMTDKISDISEKVKKFS